ncbi:hypothetical protein HP397_00800 [Streptobacillus felis]|uniref:Uncharacterized protein n=1 Tax=Streptobacillus felis TaxID=1384509 RepID=A0A7Z0T9U5_9FUSO|nr:hypothetical protein [Streptobacillus felis]NYV27365.1 hypothetical protein [Streptobacillus felis]
MKKETEKIIYTLEYLVYDQNFVTEIIKNIEIEELKKFIIFELITLYDNNNLFEKKIKLLKHICYNNIFENILPFSTDLFLLLKYYKPSRFEDDVKKLLEILKNKNIEEIFYLNISNIFFLDNKYILSDYYASKIKEKNKSEIFLNALYNRIFSNFHLNKITVMNKLKKIVKIYFNTNSINVLKNEFILNILLRDYTKAYKIINTLSKKTKKFEHQLDLFILAIYLNKKNIVKKYSTIFENNSETTFIENVNSAIAILKIPQRYHLIIFNVIENITFKYN